MKQFHPTRILFCNLSSDMGGAEITLLDLISSLDKSKFAPGVLLPSPGNFSYECERMGIEVMFLPSLPLPGQSVIKTYITIMINAFQIAKIIRKGNFEIIHANSPRAAYHACLAAKLVGKPSIIHVKDYWDSPFYSKIKSIFLYILCDRIITVSNATANEITKKFQPIIKKTSVIYDGIREKPKNHSFEINSLKREWNISGFKPVLACIGSITPLKGQETAVRALPEILNKYPNTLLLIIGESIKDQRSNYKDSLKTLITEMGLTPHVKLCGFQNNVSIWIDAIDLLVHPATLSDAFPHVLLEAGRAGKVCVASNIGGIPEIIQDKSTGILVKPNDPSDLAKGIIEVLDDPKKQKMMEQAARENIETKFSLSEFIDAIQNIYYELIG